MPARPLLPALLRPPQLSEMKAQLAAKQQREEELQRMVRGGKQRTSSVYGMMF